MTVTNAHIAPTHVAIIMDGNRRWAKAHKLPVFEGHRRGAKVAREIVEACADAGVRYLSFYAFSSENWARPAKEVDDLMELLTYYLTHEVKALAENNVILRVSGNRARLTRELQILIDEAIAATQANTGITLNLAISYGSHEEITDACKQVVHAVLEEQLRPENITPEEFRKYFYNADIPNPDMFIRPSGEYRVSNFLLWQLAYTELFFVPTLWPDFTKNELLQLMVEYSKRERRYGLRSAETVEQPTLGAHIGEHGVYDSPQKTYATP